MRYVLKIAYDGTDFAGWQSQKNGKTVQEALETALFTALGQKLKVTASGRTDAGVHSAGQVCHFDGEGITVPPEKMPDCLNRFLPSSVRVLQGVGAEEEFDANRSAKRKTYRYRLYVSEREMPLLERYAVRIENAPTVDVLQAYAKLLEGEHDYKAFCASGSAVKTTVRTVYEVEIKESEEYGIRVIEMFVTGNGFLYNMVRTMAGELLDLANGKRTKESLFSAYETGERGLLGKTMPAKGLSLMRVEYDGLSV
ncbi:MAG: tRNA pseudouridine(38-40) synthase TruA [Clostridiales bacterium]|nr:tRNA pseudouridine(38-40) synthase TruA [Clostridiales bacterium]